MRRGKNVVTLLLSVLCLSSAVGGWAAGANGSRGRRHRLIVSYKKEGLTREGRRRLAQELGFAVVFDLESAEIIVLDSPGGPGDAAEGKLRRHPGVEDVEEDFYTNWLKIDEPASFAQAPLPSLGRVLESLPKLPPRVAQDGEIPWGVARVNAPALWKSSDPSTQGAGVKVAVIDTGIDCSHPDLDCALSEGVNFVDPQAPPKDDNEHGTHVAGTIAARWDARGVVGVAPMARVVPVKVLDAKGGGAVSTIINGIVWAADNGAEVINMSLGAPHGSKAMQKAVHRAYAKGVVVVTAAGNQGPGPGTVSYPAAYPEAIAVSALCPPGITDTRLCPSAQEGIATFSSRGPQVAFAAPGVEVLSTVPGGGYAKFSGTSMASPHVAGLAALAISQGARGPDVVLRALERAARPVCPSPGNCLAKTEQGAGVVNAAGLAGGR